MFNHDYLGLYCKVCVVYKEVYRSFLFVALYLLDVLYLSC